MKEIFGKLPNGEIAYLYTLTCGDLSAKVTDTGATLVQLFVPDKTGKADDVVLGFDNPSDYIASGTYFGATIGRNSNRVKNACFVLDNKTWTMPANEGPNNLHSGPDCYKNRLWNVISHTESAISLSLHSPHGDQGMPGNAEIRVTYTLEQDGIRITYDAVSDRDTVFNLTNHSYFNLAGHDKAEKAMDQLLMLPARFFNPADSESIPTGELRSVNGTPMDFRTPKPIGRDLDTDYDALHLQGGYDHNFEVFCNPCAILSDPESGREMAVYTDCPGVQFYCGNYTDEVGKDGARYPKRSGICLETQFYPDAVNHPEWPQPIVKKGEHYHSETIYRLV